MLNIKDKQEIYEAMSAELEFGIYPMASIFLILRDTGHTPKNYSYQKGKQMIIDMPDYFEVLTEDRPVTEPEVRFFEWNQTTTSDLPGTDAETAGVENLDFLTLPLTDWAAFPIKNISLLSEKTGIADDQIPDMLIQDFEAARENRTLTFYEDKMNFPFRATSIAGNPIYITLKKSSNSFPGSRPWYFNYIYEDRSSNKTVPGKLLEQFAFLGSWREFLEKLQELALPECWDFDNEVGSLSILKSYIQYTFARLHCEGKVYISEDRSMAAFNTGLVTRHYDEIYACFEPNVGGQSPWRFLDFCIAARRGLGKRLVELFNPLPQAASYFTRKEDLLYDLNKPLLSDYEHIIIENIHRLPLEFLAEQCYGDPEAQNIITQLADGTSAQKQLDLYDELRDLISENTKLYNRIKNRIDDAINFAIKMIRWNFKTALPSYYPAANTMSLMLPLFLRGEDTVDNVLVVELTKSGNYQGQTILTPQQAYIDARLVCRPNSDWLIPLETAR